MTELTLQWIEDGRSRSETIHEQTPSQNPGIVRLGRDPSRCDIVLSDGSVSGLHVEIFYDVSRNGFYLRSLRDSNPPIVNGQSLPSGEVLLGPTNTIQLGRLQLTAKSTIPPTDVVSPASPSPAAGVPPTIIDPGTRAQTPQPPPASPPPPVPAYTPVSQSEGPRIWVWLIAGIVVIAGGALAWPAVQNLLGGNDVEQTSRRDSSPGNTDEDTAGEDSFQDKMGDLVAYTHDNRLFTIEVPRTWERRDNSKPGEAIVSWTDPDTGSAVVIDLFRTNRTLSNQQLGQLAQDFLRDAFGQRRNFRLSEPRVLDQQFVRVELQFSTSDGTLLGTTFTRQAQQMVSVASVYVLESEYGQSEATIMRILDSYRFFPDAPIR